MISKLHKWILALLLASMNYSAGTTTTTNTSFSTINLEQFDTNVLDHTIARTYKPCDALTLLFGGVHANEILKNDFYCYTFPFVNRDITSYATLLQWIPEQTNVDLKIFIQNTHDAFPATNGIQGYLNVFNTSVLQSINIAIAQAAGICIPSIVGLIQNARVEQWRVGFILDGCKRFGSLTVGAQLPLYAIARHYNLPLEDQHELQSLDVFQTNNTAKTKQEDIYPYAVETRIGLGDLVLNGAWDIYHSDRYRLSVGCNAQLPTATTFAAGFIGSNFKKIATRGCLDLSNLVEAFDHGTPEQKCDAYDSCITFGKQFVNYMGAILLHTDLGQDKRCKLGVYAQPIVKPEEQVSLILRGSLNWLLPKTLKRFIKETVNQADFADRKFDPTGHSEEFCQQALNTLNTRLTNMLFPANYCASLESQLEAQGTIGTRFQLTDAWSFTVGYDYWYRSAEYCQTTQTLNVAFPDHGLNVPTALRPRACQHNLFVQGSYLRLGAHHDLAINLGLELCMVGKGIGQDMTGVVTFEWKF